MHSDEQHLRRFSVANLALQELLVQKSVLLLQGPVGGLFGRLARRLVAQGGQVHKVCFNAGDVRDWRDMAHVPSHRFTDALDQWPSHLQALIDAHQITAIVLFGQGRPYHVPAMALAKARGVKVFVLEEGYFRPGYVTLEADGVNAYSTSMDEATDSLQWLRHWQSPRPETTAFHFAKMAWQAARYYIALHLGRRGFPQYEHHRSAHPCGHALFWVRSWVRKALYWSLDRWTADRLVRNRTPYFFVPLQSPGDSQISLHSPYNSIDCFVREVMRSFAAHAAPGDHLLFKQHPMSRGGKLYKGLVMQEAAALGLRERVHVVLEGHNPTLLNHCRGVVLINSTMGLQALTRRKPVKVLGEALFDRPGLTDPQPLDAFWQHPQPPEPGVNRWLQLLKCRTQVPCSVYAFQQEPWRALD